MSAQACWEKVQAALKEHGCQLQIKARASFGPFDLDLVPSLVQSGVDIEIGVVEMTPAQGQPPQAEVVDLATD